jgi:hypothetical protein
MTSIVKIKPKRPKALPTREEPRPRRKLTEDVVEAVQIARSHPGKWIELGRTFKTRENAHSTASCIRRGFLRVKPLPGEPTYELGGHTYMALPAASEVRVVHIGDTWQLSLRLR